MDAGTARPPPERPEPPFTRDVLSMPLARRAAACYVEHALPPAWRPHINVGVFVMKTAAFLAALLASAALAAPALADDGDPVAGKTVFKKCMACHDAVTEKDKIGPHLLGVVGRTAGTLESFASKYSQAMKDAGAAGLVWDEANIAEYVRNPKDKIPGNKMAFAGLKKDDEIANVIAYLKADPKP